MLLSSQKFINVYLKYSLFFFATLGVVFFLILQPDIGQTLLILFAWSILIFISGINFIFLITLFFILILSFSYLVLFVPKFSLY